MGYYFRCDNCFDEVDIYGGYDMNLEFHCDECGLTACNECVYDGLCEDCHKELDKLADEE